MSQAVLAPANSNVTAESAKLEINPSAEFVASAHSSVQRASDLEELLTQADSRTWGEQVGTQKLLNELGERLSEVIEAPTLGSTTNTAPIASGLKSTLAMFLSSNSRRAREGMFNLVRVTTSSVIAVGGKFRDALEQAMKDPAMDDLSRDQMANTLNVIALSGLANEKPRAIKHQNNPARLNLLENFKNLVFKSRTVKSHVAVVATETDLLEERLRKLQLQLEKNAAFERELLGERDASGMRISRGRIHEELELLDLNTDLGQAAAKRLLRNYGDMLMTHFDMYTGTIRAKRELEAKLGLDQGLEPAAPLSWVKSVNQLRAILLQQGVAL